MINKNTKDWVYNKHALITGASDGIGKELCKNLVGKCRKMSLIDRDSQKLCYLKKELTDIDSNSLTKLELYTLDICDRDNTHNLFNKIYRINNDTVEMFINCAGG